MAEIRRKGASIILNASEITEDRYGLSSGSVTYRYVRGSLPVVPTAHPSAPQLFLDKSTRRESGPFWELTALYVGVLRKTDPVWEVSTSTSSEPIETHKDFYKWTLKTHPTGQLSNSEKAALTKDSFEDWVQFEQPNGANSIGAFRAFSPNAPDDLPGVRNYMIGRQSLRKIFYTNTKPALTAPTTINTPAGAPYSAPQGRNWIYMGANIRVRGSGKIFEVTETWDMSGPKGWNAVVYTN